MSTAERLSADLAQIGFDQADAAARRDWDSVARYDQVRRVLLDALKTLDVRDSAEVRASLASAHLASLNVEQAFREARPALSAEMRREKMGVAAGKAYGAVGIA